MAGGRPGESPLLHSSGNEAPQFLPGLRRFAIWGRREIDRAPSIPLPTSPRRFDWVSMSRPDLATVLFDLHLAHDTDGPGSAPPPSPAVVAAWCACFPEHARGIREHVAAWRWLHRRGAVLPYTHRA